MSASFSPPSLLSDRCQSSKLTVEYTSSAKAKQEKETLKFGATTSDHMLEIDWDAEKGWHTPRIIPYQPLKLDPASSVLHYGLEVSSADGADRDARPPVHNRAYAGLLTSLLFSLLSLSAVLSASRA